MKNKLNEFGAFILDIMNEEYKTTINVIKDEFTKLDDMVLNIITDTKLTSDVKTERVIELVENFKTSTEMMLDLRLNKIMNENKTNISDKMFEISTRDNTNGTKAHIKSLFLVEKMVEILDMSINTYLDVCSEYTLDRLIVTLKSVKDILVVDEIAKEIKLDDEVISKLVELFDEIVNDKGKKE